MISASNKSTPDFSVSSTYSPVDEEDLILLQLDITQTNPPQLKIKQKDVLFVVDVSGSMRGKPYDTCLDVLRKILDYFHDDLDNYQHNAITFDHRAKYFELTGADTNQCIETFKKAYTAGGTSFIVFFEQIKQYLTKKKTIENLAIIILSDGQAERLHKITKDMESLRTQCRKIVDNTEFHMIGLGPNHDAVVMNAMTALGNGQNSFTYVPDASNIESCMDAIAGNISIKRLSTIVSNEKAGLREEKLLVSTSSERNEVNDTTTKPGDTKLEQSVVESLVLRYKDCIALEISQKLFEEHKKDLFITLNYSKDKQFKIQLDPQLVAASGTSATQAGLQHMDVKLRKIMNTLQTAKLDASKIEQIQQELKIHRERLVIIKRSVFRLPIDVRDSFMQKVGDVNEMLDSFTTILKKNVTSGLSNQDVAALNSLAYRDVRRQGLLKKLDKRAQKNVVVLNDVDTRVKEIGDATNEEELTARYKKEVDEVGTCIMTCYNFVEALKSGDCLCLTFAATRPEAAIADPTRLHIEQIYPTVISANSFLTCAKHAITIDHQASGGFEQKRTYEAEIFKGVSGEHVTGAMPLFICDEHWKSSRLLMKPLVGYNVTLDPTGYSYVQKKVVPLLLLTHILTQKALYGDTQFYSGIKSRIIDMCWAVIKDDNKEKPEESISSTFKKAYDNFIDDAGVRTTDTVANAGVFFSLLYLFVEKKEIEKPSQQKLTLMIKLMIQEELRRRSKGSQKEKLDAEFRQLFAISKSEIKKYAKEVAEKLQKDQEKPKEEGPAVGNINEKTRESEWKLKFLNLLLKARPSALTKEENDLVNTSPKTKAPSTEESKKVAPTPKTTGGKEESKTDEPLNSSEDEEEKLIAQVAEIVDLSERFNENGDIKTCGWLAKTILESVSRLVPLLCYELYPWVTIFYPESDPTADVTAENMLSLLGLNSLTEALSTYFQCNYQSKDSQRKAAAARGHAPNTFTLEGARDFLRVNTYRMISALALNMMSKNQRKPCSLYLEDLQIFCKTDDLDVAAGILSQGVILGDLQYIEGFMRKSPKQCKLVLEKLLMFKTKEHRDVKVYSDFFNLRKRYIRKLHANYKESYTDKDWKRVWAGVPNSNAKK